MNIGRLASDARFVHVAYDSFTEVREGSPWRVTCVLVTQVQLRAEGFCPSTEAWAERAISKRCLCVCSDQIETNLQPVVVCHVTASKSRNMVEHRVRSVGVGRGLVNIRSTPVAILQLSAVFMLMFASSSYSFSILKRTQGGNIKVISRHL